MRHLLAAVVLLAFSTIGAFAQAVPLQGGPWIAGHAPMYSTSGGAQPVLVDSGTSGGGSAGTGLSELGLTAIGTGTPPYADAGGGPNGENLCDYDAPIDNPTGYHFICLSPNAGGGGLLSYGAGGGAATLPFQISINGTPTPFGTVSSVGLSAPIEFAVSGSPVTGAGTLGLSWATETANTILAGPTTGVSTVPSFRALVGADLPLPSASTLGGVQSSAIVANQFLTGISTSGVPTAAQVSASGLSGTVPITSGGTGATSANVALNALLPSQATHSGQVLQSDGSNTSWATVSGTGTVTSVALATPSDFSVSGSPVTAAGTLTFAWANPVSVAHGGTGLASGTSGGIPYYSSTSAITSSGALTASAIVLGGGAGSSPTVLGSLGTTTTLLHGNAAGAPTFASLAYADIASGAIATGANMQANAASTLLTPNGAWSSGAVTGLTDAATIAVDMSTGINFSVTLGGNRTLGAPSNTKVGQTGAFRVTQDGTGSRTLAYNSVYKFAGGTPCVLTTTAAAHDYLFYFVFTSSEIMLSCALNVS